MPEKKGIYPIIFTVGGGDEPTEVKVRVDGFPSEVDQVAQKAFSEGFTVGGVRYSPQEITKYSIGEMEGV